jgi:hypothetical protein
MTKLFMSGPVSGVIDAGLRFRACQEQLEDAGFEIVTPINNRPLSATEGEDLWLSYMRASIRQMMTCEGVALLPGWEYSRGAQVEQALANEIGIPVKLMADWIFPEGELDR